MVLRALFGRVAKPGIAAWLRRLPSRRAGVLFELPQLVDKPEGSRVVVLAPHADDETLGCGGTLYKHHCAGDRITAVFMTDGSRGTHASAVDGKALIELREREARAAAAILGVDECAFLRNPDTRLECSPRTIAQLAGLLDSLRPDIVYAPSPLESHRDHRQACAIAAGALADRSWPVQIYLYEIWTPVPANCAVAIDLERKLQA